MVTLMSGVDLKHYSAVAVERKRRPRRPLPGMMLHLDGSQHDWFQDEGWYDLIVILDDATSEIYYAQLVKEESIPLCGSDGGFTGGGRATGCILCPLQRSSQPVLWDPEGRRTVRPATPDAGGAGAEGTGR